MFPPNNGSSFDGLVKVIVVLVIIGALAVLGLTQSDLTNFLANSVKADAMRQQNAIQAQKDAIDLQNYQTVQDTLTQTRIDQLLAEDAAHQEALEQQLQLDAQKAVREMETARLVAYLWTGAGIFLVACIGIAILLFAIKAGRSRPGAIQAEKKPVDPWQDPAWRKQQIWISRQEERAIRGSRISTASKAKSVSPFIIEGKPITWNDLQNQFIEIRKP